MTFRQREAEFFKLKSDIMNDHYFNQKQYIDEYEEVAKFNENILNDNPYSSNMNLDNYPTHRFKDPETGVEREYCGASKHFSMVDPEMQDHKSLHFAGEDRVYMLLKNKYTKEWEFPTGRIYFGQTFLRSK